MNMASCETSALKCACQQAVDREARSHTQETSGPGHSYGEIQLDLMRGNATLASLCAKSDAQNKQIAEIRREMLAFNDASFRIRTLQREIDLQDGKYRKYSEASEQARLTRQWNSNGYPTSASRSRRPWRPIRFSHVLGFSQSEP